MSEIKKEESKTNQVQVSQELINQVSLVNFKIATLEVTINELRSTMNSVIQGLFKTIQEKDANILELQASVKTKQD